MSEFGEFEVKDNSGSTVAEEGTATTTVQSVPSSPGNIIAGLSSWNDGSVPLEISFDGGTTYFKQDKKSFFSHNVKGEVRQLQVRTASGTAGFRFILNLEEY